MQMTCRDRNRLAMQADILGASTLGIKNILCLTGDHMSFGNHPEAKGVHDLDAINLIKMYKEFAEIEGVAGVHIMAIEWEVAVPEIVEAAGLMPRPAVA